MLGLCTWHGPTQWVIGQECVNRLDMHILTDLGAVWFLKNHHLSLLTQFSLLITYHWKYHNFLRWRVWHLFPILITQKILLFCGTHGLTWCSFYFFFFFPFIPQYPNSPNLVKRNGQKKKRKKEKETKPRNPMWKWKKRRKEEEEEEEQEQEEKNRETKPRPNMKEKKTKPRNPKWKGKKRRKKKRKKKKKKTRPIVKGKEEEEEDQTGFDYSLTRSLKYMCIYQNAIITMFP